MATVKEIIELAESKMHKTTDVLRVDLASVRAGRRLRLCWKRLW